MFLLFLYAYKHSENEYLTIVTVFAFTFFLMVRFSATVLHKFVELFMIIGIVETCVCLRQIAFHRAITGTLNNSGVVAIFLALQLPLFFHLCKRQSNRKSRPMITLLSSKITLCVIVADIFLIFYSHSRTALLLLGMYGLIFAFNFKSILTQTPFLVNYKKWINLLGWISASVILVQFLFLLTNKKNSFFGRYIMSHIALSHIKDHFWFGTGVGRFTWFYPSWQSEFFKSIRGTNASAANLATDSSIIFNDWVQLFETIGFLRFTICVAFIVFIFLTKAKRQKSLLFFLKVSLAAILLSAAFSYPFHINLILYFLTLILALSIKSSWTNDLILAFQMPSFKFYRSITTIIFITLMAGIFIITKGLWLKCYAVREWQQMNNHYLSITKERDKYLELYTNLNDDGKFLTDYGQFIIENTNEIDKGIKILSQARAKFMSKNLMETLAYAYWKKKDYTKAINCYLWIDNYQPFLYSPKICLMKIYIETERFDLATQMGQIIINTSPKVPSGEVSDIKRQAHDLLVLISASNQRKE
ncbi:hypothetical protein [Mucilaginibacter pocheonensis]|uniref:Tetratricopeptide (TPR) repeat protein n=1 Tax=Mucilaginibacter pocheonensis TaxID=398050 RepID=A0ABU1TC33_9SPHI|nr:hypothetical protein [Mucilaginibacter pocheonensis]MDR6942948.1 tetratricopeptide (TPR) repeat protein [Mucilaginibacter pocheonensis]